MRAVTFELQFLSPSHPAFRKQECCIIRCQEASTGDLCMVYSLKFDKNLLRMCNLKQGSVSQGLVTLGGKCLNSSLFIVVEFLPVYITVEDLLKIIFWLCKCLSSFCKFIFYEMTLDTFLPSLPCSNKSTLSQTVCILTLFLISGFVRNNFFFNATVTVPLHFNFLVVLLLAECFVTGTKTFVFVPG